jgi:pyruvyltransferase
MVVRSQMKKHIKSWWWRGDDFTNFGDELGTLMLSKLGYTVERVDISEADIFTTGTIFDLILEQAKDNAIIWGSGASWDSGIIRKFDVRAVRGKLTAMAVNEHTTYGDPGLLASLFYPKAETIYDIGVVPHYVDDNDYSWADIVIDVKDDPEKVIKQISQCSVVLSSSLHGLIVAQSYSIPAMRIHHDEVMSGNFKWLDYGSSLTKPIEQIQQDLIDAL